MTQVLKTHLPGSAFMWTAGAHTVTAASATSSSSLLVSRATSVLRRLLLLWGCPRSTSSSLSSISCCCPEDGPASAAPSAAAGFLEVAQEGQNQSPSGMSTIGGSRQSVWKPWSQPSHSSISSPLSFLPHSSHATLQ